MSLPPAAPSPAGVPRLRLVLAVSLDGRLAPPAGGPASLGGPGDRRVLEEALAWADAVLLGARTLRLHGTTCLLHRPALLAARRRRGRSPQPIAIAVSRSGAFPPELPFFRQPLERWLLLAGESAGALPQGPPAGFHRLLPHRGWPTSLQALAAAGLRRLVVLGGASLAASLAEGGHLHDLQLTLCPRLLGGAHTWLPPQTALPPAGGGWRLAGLRRLEGEELLLRYRRATP